MRDNEIPSVIFHCRGWKLYYWNSWNRTPIYPEGQERVRFYGNNNLILYMNENLGSVSAWTRTEVVQTKSSGQGWGIDLVRQTSMPTLHSKAEHYTFPPLHQAPSTRAITYCLIYSQKLLSNFIVKTKRVTKKDTKWAKIHY